MRTTERALEAARVGRLLQSAHPLLRLADRFLREPLLFVHRVPQANLPPGQLPGGFFYALQRVPDIENQFLGLEELRVAPVKVGHLDNSPPGP